MPSPRSDSGVQTEPPDAIAAPWHALPGEAVLEKLDGRPGGLSPEDVAHRLEQFGPNRLPEPERESLLVRFLRQFHDVLIYILLVAAAVTALLGEWIDTGVILAVVLINAIIGYVQEGKAEAALESIRAMLSLHAVVIRDGERREIEAADLVPADVVVVESGDRVPADLRILQARNLQVEEAMLTGESEPSEKHADPIAEDALIGDRRSMLYSGTTVTRGRATAVVVATGTATEIGKIGTMVAEVQKLTTPLLRAINDFGKRLSVIILAAAAATFAFGLLFRGFSVQEMFLLGVSLAVAAIPEGLPAIMTITLALGVQRMARRKAILRRLPAVETLGSVTVICSDKTGTLTRNEMTVARIVTEAGPYDVTGIGYAPEGLIERDGATVEPLADPVLAELIRTSLLASDAALRQSEGQWQVDGDPTEGALVVLAAKAGLGRREAEEADPRIDAIPFESENRYMAVLTDGDHGRTFRVKGAPERVFEMCDRVLTANGTRNLDRAEWEEATAGLADEGFRVLALAMREAADGRAGIAEEDLRSGLTLVGIVGIIDPPREEAIAAVADCQQAGIQVKMITGDHARTAAAIAAQLGIGDGSRAVTGAELERMSDDELFDMAWECDVFARASPEHKLRLVEALQRRGHVAAMTGDGVNDAPALRRADVGVAMGIKGAEASKDAAEMVLADDNFATIARAVREGRTIYDNLKKTILFILPTNGAEALMVLSTVAFAFAAMPITPVQILWVNMVTAVTLALALAFEPSEPGVMRRPPRDPDEPILSGYLIWRIAFVSVVIALAALWMFFRELDLVGSESQARTVAVNILVVGQFAYLFNSRFIRAPSLSLRGIFGNPYVLLAGAMLFVFQLAFTYLPIMQVWFGTAGIPLERWVLINGIGIGIFLVVEVEKAAMRALTRNPAKAVVHSDPGSE